jgi:putative endonuclease
MESNQEKGAAGEMLAVKYLQEKGFTILHRNWRRGHLEVDLVAERKGLLHFVEVKSRTSRHFGYPEERVNKEKVRNLMRAAAAYIDCHPGWKRFQIDILSIQCIHGETPAFLFIEDIYDF